MKKFFALLLSALLLATPVMAAESWTNEVVVEAAEGTATIDGNTAEWANAKAVEVKLVGDEIVDKYGHYDAGWGSADARTDNKDFTASVKFMWDKDALYILDERTDDYVELEGSGSAPYSLGDGNLIFLQVIDAGAEGNEDGYSHHIFYIVGNGDGAEGGDAYVRICDRSISGRDIVKNDSVSISAKKTSTGWVAEIAVPWSVFAEEIDGFVPAANAEIGMSMVPIDFDDDGALSQLCWVDQAGAMGIAEGYDFGGWATLKLAAAPVVETEAPATEAPATAAPVVDDAPAAPAPSAPATADMGIVAAAAVLAIAAGAVLSMKKR